MGIYHTNPPSVPTGMTTAEKAMSFLTTVAEAGLTGEQVVGTKSAAGGFPSLDGATLVPLAEIPTPLTGKDADTVDGYEGATLVRNSVLSCRTDGSSVTFSVERYYSPSGHASAPNATQANVDIVFPRAGTLVVLAVDVSVNTLDAATSIYLFKQGGAGIGPTISVGAGLTGQFSATGSGAVTALDQLCFTLRTTGSGAGAITVDSYSAVIN